MTEQLELAALSQEQVGKVTALEQRLGNVYLLAFRQPAGNPRLSAGVPVATLGREQIDLLIALEAELAGVCLVAFRGG